ncbi:MAG TPA: ABC transporter permease [Planctomycetota bacterium]|nr:ABC transporter permease [Planctomycetota bacterium]
MMALKFWPVVLKQVVRHRTRSVLTMAGVGLAMFLFCSIQALQAGLRESTEASAADTTLIVYRENRFCPFTSKLPERYLGTIKDVPGVASVIPMKIIVSNCRTSLDVVVFRGVPADIFTTAHAPALKVIEGSVADWQARSDAAIVGEVLARRRGFRVGDRFDAAGVTVTVAAIVNSPEPQDQNVAYVHLEFLQRAKVVNAPGVVTQFNVKVSDPRDLKRVAEQIDAEFRNDQAPTATRSEKAFIARAAGDLLEMIKFTRWLGLGCVAAVLALVANTVILSVQDRIREHAVLQTLGFNGSLIARMIIGEGVLLSLLGGLAGTVAAVVVLHFGSFSLTNEGFSISFTAGPDVWVSGFIVTLVLGVVAGLVPAWQASRRDIVSSFRAV